MRETHGEYAARTVRASQNRLASLARGGTLPDHITGSVLFADISGFTPITERLRATFGARHGAEQLAVVLNRVYDSLIAEVDRHGVDPWLCRRRDHLLVQWRSVCHPSRCLRFCLAWSNAQRRAHRVTRRRAAAAETESRHLQRDDPAFSRRRSSHPGGRCAGWGSRRACSSRRGAGAAG